LGDPQRIIPYRLSTFGYWHRRADERHGNPLPQGNQELLVVRDKLEEPQMSLG